jgi:predicted transcriptional regulator
MPVTLDPVEILTRLFGSVSRARILQFLLSHAGRAFYQREIMFETGLTLHPTQRELKNLNDLGIIKKRETMEKVYYEIDTLSPFFKPLCEICESAQKQNGVSKK